MSEFLGGMAAPFMWVWQLVGAYRFGVAVTLVLLGVALWALVRMVTSEESEGE